MIACLAWSSAVSATAQSLGTYLPSVYGDTASQPIPIRLDQPSTVPLIKRQALQLRETLEDSHRPYISSVFAFANEPQGNFDNRFNTITEGIEAGFYPNLQTKVQFDYLPTVFGLRSPATFGQLYQATVRSQPTDRFKYHTTLGLFHTFRNVSAGLGIVGGAGASYALNDRLSLNFDYNRSIIGNSRLSAVGVNLPGTNTLVGRVKANAFSIGPNIRLTPKTDLNFRYAGGFYAGHLLKTNPFQEFNVRLGRTIVGRAEGARLQFLQPSVQFLASNFRYDESGFGNASLVPAGSPQATVNRLIAAQLGQANTPTPGKKGPLPGGYFSPQNFYMTSMRLDAGGRLFGNTYYKVGGGLGPQNFKTTTQSLDATSIVATANVSLATRIDRNTTFELGYYFLQAGHTYQRNVLYNQASYHF